MIYLILIASFVFVYLQPHFPTTKEQTCLLPFGGCSLYQHSIISTNKQSNINNTKVRKYAQAHKFSKLLISTETTTHAQNK